MILEAGVEPVEIRLKGTTQVRKFNLVEHTGEELDQYIIDSSEVYDTALEKLRELNHNDLSSTADILMQIKEQVSEHAASLIAKLLIPEAGDLPVDGPWVYRNLSRTARGRILDQQNELNGIESVKDQGFLIEKLALTNSLAIKREGRRLDILKQQATEAGLASITQLQTGQDDLTLAEDLKAQLSPPDPSTQGSDNSQESAGSYRIETIEPSGHVEIDELEPDEDGLVRL